MQKEDIYKYFILSSQLHEAVTKWIKDRVRGTFYEGCKFNIDNIANIGGGQLGIRVDFQVPPMNDYVEEIYNVTIEELEEY